VIPTLLDLPDKYSGTCEGVIDDHDSTVVARNILLLLVAYQFPENEAVPLIIHLWYSTFLPGCMVDALQKTILPRIDQMYSKFRNKLPTWFKERLSK
jgi:hypothetical protein